MHEMGRRHAGHEACCCGSVLRLMRLGRVTSILLRACAWTAAVRKTPSAYSSDVHYEARRLPKRRTARFQHHNTHRPFDARIPSRVAVLYIACLDSCYPYLSLSGSFELRRELHDCATQLRARRRTSASTKQSFI